MKLVFIHSAEKVKIDESGNRYTDGSYSEEVWNLYLSLFDEITIVMRKDQKEYSKQECEKKYNIIPQSIRFICFPDSNKSLSSYLSIDLRSKQEKILKKEILNADAVIVRLPGTNKVVDYSRMYHKKCLVEVVGCPFDSLWNHSVKGKVLAIPAAIKLRKAVQKAQGVIYVTERFLQKKYPTSNKSIGCSDVKIKNMSTDVLENRIQKNRSHSGRLIIGTAAGIGVKYKGQQYVIRALEKLKNKGITCFEYQIAGNGDCSFLKSEAKKCGVANQVKFVGSIPHEEIFNWYNNLDLYIQPSKQEGLPRALIEAMSCAVPCIGSNAGGIPELLDKEVIFSKGNVAQLTSIMIRMMDGNTRIKYAKRNFKKSKEYNPDKLQQRRVSFMKSFFDIC